MKALTLRNPWAALVMVGAKTIETRSWSTNFRGPLAIHAAAGFSDAERQLCYAQPFNHALTSRPDIWFVLPESNPDELPLGAVVATCELLDVQKLHDAGFGYSCVDLLAGEQFDWKIDDERAFGDYTPGRYAWLLGNVRPFNRPIPAKGRLGLWEWDPAEVLV